VARARTPRAAMPGVRAVATRRASGGCGAGLGFAAQAAGARGKKGTCARAVTPGCRGAGRRAGLADDARERGRGGRERGKEGRGRLRPVVARRGRAATGPERAGRVSGRRKKGKLTGGSRPLAAPGGGEGEGSRVSWCRWAGPGSAGWLAGKKERGREIVGLRTWVGSGCTSWAGFWL
jgi:hypothetical protein